MAINTHTMNATLTTEKCRHENWHLNICLKYIVSLKCLHVCEFHLWPCILTLVRVMRRPRIDVIMMMPTSQNDMCCDQNITYNAHNTSAITHAWDILDSLDRVPTSFHICQQTLDISSGIYAYSSILHYLHNAINPPLALLKIEGGGIFLKCWNPNHCH